MLIKWILHLNDFIIRLKTKYRLHTMYISSLLIECSNHNDCLNIRLWMMVPLCPLHLAFVSVYDVIMVNQVSDSPDLSTIIWCCYDRVGIWSLKGQICRSTYTVRPYFENTCKIWVEIPENGKVLLVIFIPKNK